MAHGIRENSTGDATWSSCSGERTGTCAATADTGAPFEAYRVCHLSFHERPRAAVPNESPAMWINLSPRKGR